MLMGCFVEGYVRVSPMALDGAVGNTSCLLSLTELLMSVPFLGNQGAEG